MCVQKEGFQALLKPFIKSFKPPFLPSSHAVSSYSLPPCFLLAWHGRSGLCDIIWMRAMQSVVAARVV